MNTQNVNTAASESSETWVNPAFYSATEGAFSGFPVSAEDDHNYWLRREQAAVSAPKEIDVHRYHDALGLMYPRCWATSENGEYESFMLDEMNCGRVTEIFARIGGRYYRLRDYSHLNHAQIMTRVKEELAQKQK